MTRPADLTPHVLVLAAAILLLQRFWLFGRVPLILPIVGAVLLAAHHRGAVTMRSDRLLAFLILGALAAATTFLNGCLGNEFSPQSLAYLLATYCVFVATPTAPRDHVRLLRLWQSLSLLCALLGILQFAAYLTTGHVLDLLALLPGALLDNPGYNTIHFDRTHTFLRANGMIFLEASFFSQFMALAFVVELTFLRNPYRLGCFLVALLCALSGTGILMAAVGLLATVLVQHRASFSGRRLVVPLAAAAAVLLLVILFAPGLAQYFADRARSEFTLAARQSSSYIRFVAPWAALYELGQRGIAKVVLGLGPGWFTVGQLQMPISPNLHPISQVGVYYGVFTTVAYLVFLALVTIERYTRPQWVVMATVLFQYLFCAGNLLAPNIVAVLLWFCLVFYPPPTPAKPAKPAGGA